MFLYLGTWPWSVNVLAGLSAYRAGPAEQRAAAHLVCHGQGGRTLPLEDGQQAVSESRVRWNDRRTSPAS